MKQIIATVERASAQRPQAQRIRLERHWLSPHDHGRLAPGCKADINILDIETLMLDTPRKVEDLRGGGSRFVQGREGIAAIFVAGQAIYRSGALPARLVSARRTAPAEISPGWRQSRAECRSL